MNVRKTLTGLALLGLTFAYTGCAPGATRGDDASGDQGREQNATASQPEEVSSDVVSPEEFATLQTATYEIYPTPGFDVSGAVQVTEDVDVGGARVAVTLKIPRAGSCTPHTSTKATAARVGRSSIL